MLDIPYYKQEHEDWCGPASLAMVLGYFKKENVSQVEIARAVVRDSKAVTRDMMFFAAMKGMHGSILYQFGGDHKKALVHLRHSLSFGIPPIVLQRSKPSRKNSRGHFRVVFSVESLIHYHDPLYGEGQTSGPIKFRDLWTVGDSRGEIGKDYVSLIVEPTPSIGGRARCPYCSFDPGRNSFVCANCHQSFMHNGFPSACGNCGKVWTQLICGSCKWDWEHFAPDNKA